MSKKEKKRRKLDILPRCVRCHKPLKDPTKTMGPVCAAKAKIESMGVGGAPTEKEQT